MRTNVVVFNFGSGISVYFNCDEDFSKITAFIDIIAATTNSLLILISCHTEKLIVGNVYVLRARVTGDEIKRLRYVGTAVSNSCISAVVLPSLGISHKIL